MIVLVFWITPDILMAQRGANTSPAVAPCTFTNNQLTLLNVIDSVERAILDNNPTMECIAERIRRQGTTFDRIPLVVDTLKQKGAGEVVISAIKVPVPVPAPPVIPNPPRPRIAGDLTVSCSSPECDVYIGGLHQTTKSGSTVLKGLSPGTFPLVVYKDGFRFYSETINLVENVPKSTNVQLQAIPPDPSIPGLQFKSFLWDVTVANSVIAQVEGKGRLSWSGSNNKPSPPWEVPEFTKASGAELSITFKNKSGTCKVTVPDPSLKPTFCAKLKNDPDVDIISAANLFLEYQPSEVAALFSGRQFERVPGNSRQLRTVDGPGSYLVTLNEQNLPVEVNHQSGDEQWRVVYSDFKTFGKISYPTQMTIDDKKSNALWLFVIESVKAR